MRDAQTGSPSTKKLNSFTRSQDEVVTDELVTCDVNSDPHGEEAHRAVSNHVARLLFETQVDARSGRRCPSFETRTMCAPQDEVVISGANSDPHGEEAHRALSNHVARLLL